MTIALIFLAAVVAFVAIDYYRRKRAPVGDIVVPEPAAPQPKLCGYYGCETGQVDAVKGHTNLHWDCQFHGAEQTANDILAMACTTVLSVGPQLFEKVAASGKNWALKKTAETELRSLFDYLAARGALKYVKAIVPMDEPNTNVRDAFDLLTACQMVRSVARSYLALDGVKLACIYARQPASYTCIEQFDWVGFDDYDIKSTVLTCAEYWYMMAAKKPGARK